MVEVGTASVHLLRVVQQAGLILVCPGICRAEMYLDNEYGRSFGWIRVKSR